MAQIFHCDGNARCIELIIPMLILMFMLMVKLYTFQFNSNKVCLSKFILNICSTIIQIFIIFRDRDLLRSSDYSTIQQGHFYCRSELLLIICVTIGKSCIARRNTKLWKNMLRTQNWLLWHIPVRRQILLYYFYFNKWQTIISFCCSIFLFVL